ncbi:hypothetical protein PsorP6_008557 [Peronosclerospora sorghi]|uniref:Uncharacterized protein n=1 Tax=Peronosclerospora sorghi TaxID=230839 RepID=A0ACC0W7I4_9STRA|nr:hypothetical protein PsorP6_008557 [Peronosclerospora sorghi]
MEERKLKLEQKRRDREFETEEKRGEREKQNQLMMMMKELVKQGKSAEEIAEFRKLLSMWF